jgi:methionine-rich copper-binding protein CopC
VFFSFSTLLVPGGSGLAHSLLIESSPGANSTVGTSPAEMVLRFNNRIEKKLSRIRLVGVGGEKLDALTLSGRVYRF